MKIHTFQKGTIMSAFPLYSTYKPRFTAIADLKRQEQDEIDQLYNMLQIEEVPPMVIKTTVACIKAKYRDKKKEFINTLPKFHLF